MAHSFDEALAVKDPAVGLFFEEARDINDRLWHKLPPRHKRLWRVVFDGVVEVEDILPFTHSFIPSLWSEHLIDSYRYAIRISGNTNGS